MSEDVMAELVHYDVCAVLDLTPCDGRFAAWCSKKSIQYLGIAYNEQHKEALEARVKDLRTPGGKGGGGGVQPRIFGVIA